MKVILALSILMIAAAMGNSNDREYCYRNAVHVCPCHKILDPVCGVNGCTYPNPCELKCARVKMWHEGECLTKDASFL
ncbi:leech-derived tryptase inhibitor C-like [Ostrinia nubilalis]|uniref:leech-derived tryptase inhibitor C-like n=1 Tax=Ostrinia nubilalis TaxID=29057 RepID=UPI00308266E4